MLMTKIIRTSSTNLETSLLFIILIVAESINSQKCTLEDLNHSAFTECGPTKCDLLFNDSQHLFEWPTSTAKVAHISSTRSGKRFKMQNLDSLELIETAEQRIFDINTTIYVEPDIKFQKIFGFGTTLTDVSCSSIATDLGATIRSRLIKDYFNHVGGIGLKLVKIPVDANSDFNGTLNRNGKLSDFDLNCRIPLIKEAMNVASNSKQPNQIKTVISLSSIPTYLSSNDSLGRLDGVKYLDYTEQLMNLIKAYNNHGINIWALSLSNEPLIEKHNSVLMDAREAQRIITGFVGPKLNLMEDRPPLKLLLLDGDRRYIPQWSDMLHSDYDVSRYVAGMTYKCQDISPYDTLSYAIKQNPNKFLLAAQSRKRIKTQLGDWQHAQDQVVEILKNLEYGSVGWIDSNLALVFDNNVTSESLDSAINIISDGKRSTYFRNPMFYAIGHFSRYVTPDSVRIQTKISTQTTMLAAHHIAFLTPDDYVVIIVINDNEHLMPIRIGSDSKIRVYALMESKSFNTFIYKR